MSDAYGHGQEEARGATDGSFREKLGLVMRSVLLVLLLILIFLRGLKVVLLVFAGILLGIFFSGLAYLVSRYTKISRNLSLAAVLVVALVFAVMVGSLAAPSVSEQLGLLVNAIPESISSLGQTLSRYPYLQSLAGFVSSKFSLIGTQIAGQITIVGTTVVEVAIVIFIGIAMAAQPKLYFAGTLRLFPEQMRPRAEDVMFAIAHTLRRWLLGKAISTITVGVLTSVGLAILGIPLSFILGLIAALLTFVPHIGPIVAAIPALLLALVKSPGTVVYVTALYLAVQAFDSYVVTPLVERKTVYLPPALTVVVQVFLGVIAGGWGVLLAAPLTAAALAAYSRLYLGEK